MPSTAAVRDIHLPPHAIVRVAGRDRPLSAVVAHARALPVALKCAAPAPTEDYALLDPALTVAAVAFDALDENEPAPAPGLGYAAFTPRQRGWFLAWQATPLSPAPPAFQQLYLANLEVSLLEGNQAAYQQLDQLLQSDGWTRHPALWRVALLAVWLVQDGGLLAKWLTTIAAPVDVSGVALGMQALLETPLTAAEVRQVARTWGHPAAAVSEAVLTFRLQSLGVALGAEPLAWALAQLDAAARTPQPWRCQHRDLRVELPQPDVRRPLEALLVELAQVTETATASLAAPAATAPAATGAASAALAVEHTGGDELSRAHLILEFRQSRSEFFAVALRQAQKRAGFMQLLDEDRHVVYRVAFRKNELNAFWQLWNYVQNWTGTSVYCKGQELQKWQVYPYSQYLR